jgi:xylulokinase
MAATLSAGMSLRWLRDQILDPSGAASYSQMTAWAEATPTGANGLLFLPYLTGERSPHMDPQARGMFLGLTARHGRAELTRAVMEGVSLGCYDAYAVLAEIGAQPERIILAGGGARSRLWQEIIADVFGLTVKRLGVAEQSALGALLLAGAGIGLFDLVPTAQAWASYDPPVEPNSQRHHVYQEQLLPLFRGAYQKYRLEFQKLQELESAGNKVSTKPKDTLLN